jgi:hypothetical protein
MEDSANQSMNINSKAFVPKKRQKAAETQQM